VRDVAARREARRLGQTLGIASGLLALTQVVVVSSGAAFNEAAVLTMQHALADLSEGGGALLTPAFNLLLRFWVVAYGVAFCSFLMTLGLCWYAGRVSAQVTRQRNVGATAGYWVMLVGGLVWIAGSVLAALVLHADSTISWLLATIAYTLITPPQSAPVVSIYVTHPSTLFQALQLVILLFQQVIGLALALGGGALAGRIGAQSVRFAGQASTAAWQERYA
jgi:hypothetical protein